MSFSKRLIVRLGLVPPPKTVFDPCRPADPLAVSGANVFVAAPLGGAPIKALHRVRSSVPESRALEIGALAASLITRLVDAGEVGHWHRHDGGCFGE